MTSSPVPGTRPADGRVLPIDRLRAFLTALVVTHHAVLAYHPYAPNPPDSLTSGPMIWGAFPIVDTARWPGVDLLVGFDDSFFMALMFLVAGLFVPDGFARRGAGGYLRERARRLGVPFLVAAGVLAPIAYAATYAQITAMPSVAGFLSQWLALGAWPAGPAWFLWVLLAFGAIAMALYRFSPRWTAWFACGDRPARAWLVLVGASVAAYLPLAAVVDPMHWSSFGPCFVQTARIGLYLVYFLAGAALGAAGADRGLLSRDGKLARRWWLWGNTAPFAFFALIAVLLVLLGTLRNGPAPVLATLCNFAFVVSCATTSFAMLAAFLRWTRKPSRVWESLGANAYGIYLLHYPIVAWTQYALLDLPLAGWQKGVVAISVGIGASWLATAALRRVPLVERVIGRGGGAARGPAPVELVMA